MGITAFPENLIAINAVILLEFVVTIPFSISALRHCIPNPPPTGGALKGATISRPYVSIVARNI